MYSISLNGNFFQGYGKADHTISVELLKKVYPDYEITWSDEGY
jgi:phosphohistidine phosphatase